MPNIPVVENGWENLDIETIPLLNMPPLTDVVQQTLARLMGWDENSKGFRRVSVDMHGRLIVDTGEFLFNEIAELAVNVNLTSVVILPANPNRKKYIVINGGSNTAYIGFSSLVGQFTGFRLPAGGFLEDDSFNGDVWAIGAAVNTLLYILGYGG